MTQRQTVLLDANVLYPAPLRDVLLQLAVADLFRARWTEDIHREWIEALLAKEAQRDRAILERTRHLMDKAIPDCLVTDYEKLIPDLTLPDPNDRHVLAAAIIGQCDIIITQNLKDFPQETLSVYEIEVQAPDPFLRQLLGLEPLIFCECIRKIRARLKNPPFSTSDYLSILRQQGLRTTVEALEPFQAQL
jgi:predicted nucleic acid-binding protein